MIASPVVEVARRAVIMSYLAGQCLNQQRVTAEVVKQTQQLIPRAADSECAPQIQRVIVAESANKSRKTAGQRQARHGLQIRRIKPSADQCPRCSNACKPTQEI